MKVKCVSLLNSDGRAVDFSPWLTVGKEYCVFGVHIDKSGIKRFRIATSDRGPVVESLGLHLSECFEVVSDYRPSNWVDREINGGFEMSPSAWQAEGFWEAVYDGDSKANTILERETNLICNEE